MSITVGYEVLVVYRQQMHEWAARTAGSAQRPVGRSIDLHLDRRDHLEPTRRVGCGQPGPPHKVAQGRGAVALKVPMRELAERVIAGQPPRVGRALVQQRVGRLFDTAWAGADHAFQLEIQHDMAGVPTLPGQARAGEMRTHFLSSQKVAVAQHTLADLPCAIEHRGIETELAIIRRHAAVYVGCRELEHPPDVLGCDEVPGGTHDVSTEDAARIERVLHLRVRDPGAEAQAQSPLRRAELLGLHRAKPGHEPRGIAQLVAGDALVRHALLDYRHQLALSTASMKLSVLVSTHAADTALMPIVPSRSPVPVMGRPFQGAALTSRWTTIPCRGS